MNGGILHHSPHIGRRQLGYGNSSPQQGRNHLSLNANAREFQLTASQQHQIQNQQLANLLGQLDPNFLASATTNLGLYSIQQSKSLGNNLNALLYQQQQQGKQPPPFNPVAPLGGGGLGGAIAFLQQQQRSQAILTSSNNNFSLQQQPNNNHLHHGPPQIGAGQFNRLCQSKSSGSIPDNVSVGVAKPRVRFIDVETDDETKSRNNLDEATANMIRNTENRFSDLKINGKQGTTC